MNKFWTEGTDKSGRIFSRRIDDGFTEYQLDLTIAQRIKELRLGLNGMNMHSWRAIAIECTGYEDQMTGKDLCRLAAWTLGEDWDE